MIVDNKSCKCVTYVTQSIIYNSLKKVISLNMFIIYKFVIYMYTY